MENSWKTCGFAEALRGHWLKVRLAVTWPLKPMFLTRSRKTALGSPRDTAPSGKPMESKVQPDRLAFIADGRCLERYWAKVKRLEACWEWTGATGSGGYGSFKLARGVSIGAHRFGLMVATEIDPTGFQVRHSCDNPLCCNPAHLSWGTHQDNQDDKAKARAARYAARLTTAAETE